MQPADFSANDPFHVAVETLANNTWLPDHKGRWFYERARGSYGAAEIKASFRAAEKRRFAAETPKERRFSKTDLAKYLNTWDGLPHLVSYGNQKNFQSLMQALKEQHPDGFVPDETPGLCRQSHHIQNRPGHREGETLAAYQANITAYTVACLSWKSGGSVDFERIWSQQAVSPELRTMIEDWVVEIDRRLRETAKARMPSEWAKKSECWDAIRETSLPLPDPLPPELQIYTEAAQRRAIA